MWGTASLTSWIPATSSNSTISSTVRSGLNIAAKRYLSSDLDLQPDLRPPAGVDQPDRAFLELQGSQPEGQEIPAYHQRIFADWKSYQESAAPMISIIFFPQFPIIENNSIYITSPGGAPRCCPFALAWSSIGFSAWTPSLSCTVRSLQSHYCPRLFILNSFGCTF